MRARAFPPYVAREFLKGVKMRARTGLVLVIVLLIALVAAFAVTGVASAAGTDAGGYEVSGGELIIE